MRYRVGLVLLGVVLCPGFAVAEIPLHQRIDELIEEGAAARKISLEPLADDADFHRRAYLDLAGRIPTIAETRDFLADGSSHKRTKLVDRLLNSAVHPRRMAELFHVMLMERRAENEEWTKFLRHACAENESWDAIARAIIHPNADDEVHRGAAFFITSRLTKEGAMAEVDVPGLTRDVGRLLAGVDLQCAQCHDHLDIEQYRQRDFQGLHMVFENVQSRRDTGFPAVSEKLMTAEKEFMSVFIQEQETTSPVVPGGETIDIVTYDKDDEYLVPPDKKKKQPGVPNFSPLKELATGLTSGDNKLFAKNFVNRLWHAMMGRGLVEPLDLIHADNPPSHPELLELLASEFVAHDFDIRWLIRELALTNTYARTSQNSSQAAGEPSAFAVAQQRRISAEQLFRSVLVATGELNRHGKSWSDPPEELEAFVDGNEELKSLRELFVKTFANPPREPELEFAPTVKAALLFMHEERLLKLLQPRDGNLTDQLLKLEDEEAALADKLFLAVLSRPPTEEDRVDVSNFLASSEDKQQAIQNITWALLSSTEFCVNH